MHKKGDVNQKWMQIPWLYRYKRVSYRTFSGKWTLFGPRSCARWFATKKEKNISKRHCAFLLGSFLYYLYLLIRLAWQWCMLYQPYPSLRTSNTNTKDFKKSPCQIYISLHDNKSDCNSQVLCIRHDVWFALRFIIFLGRTRKKQGMSIFRKYKETTRTPNSIETSILRVKLSR